MSRNLSFRPRYKAAILWCLLLTPALMVGCEVKLRPVFPIVEYASGPACAPTADECPWAELEHQASFRALVNCLLVGATVIRIERPDEPLHPDDQIVAAIEPKYGYERIVAVPDGETCPSQTSTCSVASLRDQEITWATCGPVDVEAVTMRGGADLRRADRLTQSVVVTGTLTQGINAFRPPQGLDGPDHFYTFTLTERIRVETAVASNTSYWSAKGPTRAPWQPALSLLSAGGETLQEGKVFRAGVTYLFPAELPPGTYYLVVDSSNREASRGSGLYRLYLGLDEELMGPIGS